jgi:hypothetical protein
MSHDLIAELTGYRNALSSAQRYGKDDKAKEIQGEVDRVTGDLNATVEHLLAQAEEHDNVGQHTLGAQKRQEATRLRRALEPDQAPAVENTADSTPREKAVNRSGKRQS